MVAQVICLQWLAEIVENEKFSLQKYFWRQLNSVQESLWQLFIRGYLFYETTEELRQDVAVFLGTLFPTPTSTPTPATFYGWPVFFCRKNG